MMALRPATSQVESAWAGAPDAAPSLTARLGDPAQDVLLELLEGFHVIAGRSQVETDRMHAQVRDAAHRPPRRELLHPLLRRDLRESHPPLDAELGRIAPGRLDVAVEPVHWTGGGVKYLLQVGEEGLLSHAPHL